MNPLRLDVDFQALTASIEFKVPKLISKTVVLNYTDNPKRVVQFTARPEANTVHSCGFLDESETVMELKFNSFVNYLPGDRIAIIPKNDQAQVDAVFKLLGWNDQFIIELGVTTREFFMGIDFLIVRKSFLRLLAQYAVADKRKLLYLSSTIGKESFNQLLSQRPTLLDLLHLFPSLNPPIEILIANMSKLKQRFYSIAKQDGQTKSIAFKITGLCTRYLANLSSGDVFTGHKNSSSILYPHPDNLMPVVMICNGVGISPFIFIANEMSDRKITLYYGHRTAKDSIYEESLKTDNIDVKHCLSQQGDGEYVQDRLEITNTLFNSIILVCGSIRMSMGVHDKLVQLYCQQNICGSEDAAEFLAQKKIKKEYVQEIWG